VENDLAIKTSIENIKALRQELVEIDKKIKDIQAAAKKTKGAAPDDDDALSI